MTINDNALRDLESRLKNGKVSVKEMKELMPKIVSLLRSRSRRLEQLTSFANGVCPEDALYVTAYGVWRRKVQGNSAPLWVRSNPPKDLTPPAASTTGDEGGTLTGEVEGVVGR